MVRTFCRVLIFHPKSHIGNNPPQRLVHFNHHLRTILQSLGDRILPRHRTPLQLGILPLSLLNLLSGLTLTLPSFLLLITLSYLPPPFLHPRQSPYLLSPPLMSITIPQPICSVYWLPFLPRLHLPMMPSQVQTLSQLYLIRTSQKMHLVPLYGAPSHPRPAHPYQILLPPSHSMQEIFLPSHSNPTSCEYSNIIQQQMKYS